LYVFEGAVVQYKAKEPGDADALFRELEPVINGLGYALIELSLYRGGKKAGIASAQVRLIIGGKSGGHIDTTELSLIHRAVLPRLELAMKGADLYLEVSSPGIDRLIKEGAEFRHYSGMAVKCWLKGAEDWKHGILRGSDKEKITMETGEGTIEPTYETIAKARLDG
jgi:ribosome maturation factor RimP